MQEWRDDCVFGKARKNTREKLVGKFLGLCDYVIVLGGALVGSTPGAGPWIFSPLPHSRRPAWPSRRCGSCPPSKAADLTTLVAFDSHNVTLSAGRTAGFTDPHDDLNTSTMRA